MEVDLSKFPDRRYIKRSNQKSYRGWQFAYERPDMYETKFFNDNKFGGAEGAYQAAIEYRNNFLKAASDLGVYDEYTN